MDAGGTTPRTGDDCTDAVDHERNQLLAVRPELVEGLNQSFLKHTKNRGIIIAGGGMANRAVRKLFGNGLDPAVPEPSLQTTRHIDHNVRFCQIFAQQSADFGKGPPLHECVQTNGLSGL